MLWQVLCYLGLSCETELTRRLTGSQGIRVVNVSASFVGKNEDLRPNERH